MVATTAVAWPSLWAPRGSSLSFITACALTTATLPVTPVLRRRPLCAGQATSIGAAKLAAVQRLGSVRKSMDKRPKRVRILMSASTTPKPALSARTLHERARAQTPGARKAVWVWPDSAGALEETSEHITNYVMEKDWLNDSPELKFGNDIGFAVLYHRQGRLVLANDDTTLGVVYKGSAPQASAVWQHATAALITDDDDDGHIVAVDAAEWPIINFENLVATKPEKAILYAVVRTAASGRDMLNALFGPKLVLGIGTDGIILKTSDVEEMRQLAHCLEAEQQHPTLAPTSGLRSNINAANRSVASPLAQTQPPAQIPQQRQQLALVAATVTKLSQLGVGDRVCVDLCSLLRPGEGMLVGSFARGLFLVHSECMQSDYINSRPFRVNAGPVHAYVAAPNGNTAYLSELKTGSEMLVADYAGATRLATVGRVKIETRPMVLVEAEVETEDGTLDTYCTTLQNAETVRLVKASGADAVWSDDRAISVSELQAGDKVLVHRQHAARHTGIPINEFVVER
eukprot:jgi/Chlat1/4438/Chrsp29S08888